MRLTYAQSFHSLNIRKESKKYSVFSASYFVYVCNPVAMVSFKSLKQKQQEKKKNGEAVPFFHNVLKFVAQ